MLISLGLVIVYIYIHVKRNTVQYMAHIRKRKFYQVLFVEECWPSHSNDSIDIIVEGFCWWKFSNVTKLFQNYMLNHLDIYGLFYTNLCRVVVKTLWDNSSWKIATDALHILQHADASAIRKSKVILWLYPPLIRLSNQLWIVFDLWLSSTCSECGSTTNVKVKCDHLTGRTDRKYLWKQSNG